MTKSEIIQQAKHFFGKDKTFIKDALLSYEFNGKNYKQWRKEIGQIISNPFEIKYHLFEDVIIAIVDNKSEEIDWNWIGDLSWTIDIILNPNIDKGYDWDKKLALKCNGTVSILKVFISDIIPCYTYDCYYMTFNKTKDYYEFGPLTSLKKDEQKIVKKITDLMLSKELEYLDKAFCDKKLKELYSDANSDGNASLFDVLFSDTHSYQTEIVRFCNKPIIEKNGAKYSWREYYNKNGSLKERIESRWTSGGDYLGITLDNKGQIKNIKVTRKKIGGEKFQQFELDIIEAYNNKKKLKANKKV